MFVCLGNICRSPVAEGVFSYLVKKGGLSNKFNIDSCGTAAYHTGEQPDSRMCQTAAKYGVHLSHRARQITEEDLEFFDHILVMDNSNYADIMKLCTSDLQSEKVHLYREYDNNSDQMEVPDPYYGGVKGFEDVFVIVKTCGENLLLSLK